MRAAVIINPASGTRTGVVSGRKRAAIAAEVLGRHRVDADIRISESPGHACVLAREVVSRGAEIVFAWGGDGTVNEVVSGLAFGPSALALVSAGSGNGLAREFRVPSDPARALAWGLQAPERLIDLGELNGRLFANVTGVGFDAEVAARFNAPGPHGRGFLRYALIVARLIFSYTPAAYTITWEDGRIEQQALLVAVANSRQYGGGARIAPQARVDDGKLDLVVVGVRSVIGYLLEIRRLFDDSLPRAPSVLFRQVRDVTVATPGPVIVHVDGEPTSADPPLKVRVHPRALRIRA